MADYIKLIDQETWRFIEETVSHYPDDTTERTISEQRRIYSGLCKAFNRPHPAGMHVSDHKVADVACRTYVPQIISNDKIQIVFFHGGGFVVGDLDSHDDVCAGLSQMSGLKLTTVNYRLAPEHKHPASFDDCFSAVTEICKTSGQPVILVGDSAGGNLAAAVSHVLRRSGCKIAGQILIYPVLAGADDKPSYAEHAHAPMLTQADMAFYQTIRCQDGIRPTGDVTFAPLDDVSFEHLPQTHLFAAECDPLFDDAVAYHEQIQAAGGDSWLYQETGLVHGYLRARHSVKRARNSFRRIVDAVVQIASTAV